VCCRQFHQHFTRAFYASIFAPKKLQSQNVAREKLRTALLYKKGTHKMLIKLTHGFPGLPLYPDLPSFCDS